MTDSMKEHVLGAVKDLLERRNVEVEVRFSVEGDEDEKGMVYDAVIVRSVSLE